MEEETKDRTKDLQVVKAERKDIEVYRGGFLQVSNEFEKFGVKSSAIVKFASVGIPSTYRQLQNNTNLNRPPENWLRAPTTKFFGPEKKETESLFTSFKMAAAFPDCIGEVDVVSDAENIKKLLKIPYSKGPVSMMVHRVGNTLLLDNFDIHTHLLRTAENEWSWLKKFYFETVLNSLRENHKGNRTTKTNKHKRDYLQKKNLVSKFLYHTLAAIQEPTYSLQENVQAIIQRQDVQQAIAEFPELLLDENKTAHQEKGLLQHARNIIWSFEDSRMLIGTDMPIFGGGTHPCVSLRLRDMNKPINILTGLDYWLDNLMCNVPEVVMCYHLEGIVQKYELFKTEDLPDLPNSQFKPGVVRDVAQNILSFLKSKATKAGHTYWLFKGKDDDVVKLYDLTSLCSDLTDDPGQNPFTTPVAYLLYQVAKNLRNSQDWKHHRRTIVALLKKCDAILDQTNHPQLAVRVLTLMADTDLPTESDPDSKNEPEPSEDFADNNWHPNWDETCDEGQEDASSVDVNTLCTPNGIQKNDEDGPNNSQGPRETLEERCQRALESIVKAMRMSLSLENRKKKKAQQEEEPNMATPLKPIPMPYQSLENLETQKNNLKIERRKLEIENYQLWMNAALQKCIQCYVTLAEGSSESGTDDPEKVARSTHYLNMAALLWRYLEQPLPDLLAGSSAPSTATPMHSYAMGVSGDVYFSFVQHWSTISQTVSNRDFMSDLDYALCDILNQYFGTKNRGNSFPIPQSLQEALELSMASYQSALLLLGLSSSNRPTCGEDYARLAKRLGNVCNEIGVFYMSKIEAITDEQDRDIDTTWKLRFLQLFQASQAHLEAGVSTFKKVQDTANAALLLNNLGRLYRLQAKALSPNKMKELTLLEWKCYSKACQSYEEGLKILERHKEHGGIWDAVVWEFSSTLFTLASLLQDYAPLSIKSREEIEAEISRLLTKCIQVCDIETQGPRQPLYQYRVATAHYRLASLYHDKYRNGTGEAFVNGKNVRSLAESHYAVSLDTYGLLDSWDESLRIILEHVGLYEFQLKNLTGNGSKIKVLQTILKVLLKSTTALEAIKGSSDFDMKAVTTLTGHLIQRLQSTLLQLAKLSKTSKKPSCEASVYVKMYSKSLTVYTQDVDVIAKTADLLLQLNELYSLSK